MFLWYVFMYPFAIIYACDGMCTLHKFPYPACTISIKCSHLDSFLEKPDVKPLCLHTFSACWLKPAQHHCSVWDPAFTIQH